MVYLHYPDSKTFCIYLVFPFLKAFSFLGCISFVFATMVELAIVCYTAKCNKQTSQSSEEEYVDDYPIEEIPSTTSILKNGSHLLNRSESLCPTALQSCDEDIRLHSPVQQQRKDSTGVPQIIHMLSRQDDKSKKVKIYKSKHRILVKFKVSPETIDKISMLLFPLSFTIFNATYWWCYVGNSHVEENLTLQY